MVAARAQGHVAFGLDTDPLAVLIAKAWCEDSEPTKYLRAADRVLNHASTHWRKILLRDAYPINSDDETRKFVRYWFDARNRRQLRALSDAIRRTRNKSVRNLLWCTFSRVIISKQSGASRAMDLSHSRPHRAFEVPPVTALEKFPLAVRRVLAALNFQGDANLPAPIIAQGDARNLPFDDGQHGSRYHLSHRTSTRLTTCVATNSHWFGWAIRLQN